MQLQTIIQGCKRQNITAQKKLYSMFCKQMFLLCRRYVKTNEEAEEVMMTGFLKIYKSIQEFVYINDAKTFAYIKKVMVMEALQHLRNNESFLTVSLEEVNSIEITETVYECLSTQEIYSYIIQLPTGYKAVFNLFEIEGYTHKEIATMLHIAEGTSKSQLNKAKKMLQELIIKNNNLYEQRQSK